jgi:hypothetical protein
MNLRIDAHDSAIVSISINCTQIQPYISNNPSFVPSMIIVNKSHNSDLEL